LLDIVVFDANDVSAAQQGVDAGCAIADGVKLTRDLVNLPPNVCDPAYLAKAVDEAAQAVGLKIEVLEKRQMEALGMGALLGVAQGSQTPPHFIILEHNADKADELDTIVLVGKGVTFDTGGYSIKTGEGMVGMKADMAGGAAVIGAMRIIGALKVPLHVVGLVPAADNMISGNAYRPQEVLRASNGVTIEIISTDAEGRLLLADALVFASRYKPAVVVDIATLTGACVVALGGVFSSDDKLRDALMNAASRTSEKIWPLPLFPEYDKMIESQAADIKNTGGRFGGAATAAAFLKHFVDYPAWAHIDMAGMAGIDNVGGSNDNPYVPSKGATGFGARLLADFVRGWGR
jgi:leucyl aminopeptidase